MFLLKVIVLCYSIYLVRSSDNLKQIHILFRHGERAPSSLYPNDPHKDYKWPTLGYLTNRGEYQMYTLGQNLRQHYKEFIPIYYMPIEVNFTSSYADRCLISAQLVAAGLFPPSDFQVWNPDLLWQPIPIHYLPRNMDNLIAMKTNCTRYDNEFIEVQHSAKVQKFNEDYKELFDYLTKKTGMAVNNIETVESLFNTLEIEQLNNLTLPDWANSTILSQMKIIGARNLAIYSETEYMKKMKGGFFLKIVINLMGRLVNGSTIPLINMYSGHDLTLVHVLRALSLIDTIKPEFGASLIFELHANAEIKIFYLDSWKGIPQEQILKECNNPCTIEQFNNIFKAVLPINWEQECQLE